MAFKLFLLICAQAFLIKIICGQCISNPETRAASLLQDGISIADGLTLGSNLGANNIPIGTNMAANLPIPLNNIGMPVGSNIDIGANWPAGLGSARLGFPGSISPAAMAPPMGIAASNGGGFTVTSSSPIAPTGLTVNSENAIEGSLIVSGQLPFLGSVATDGAFPTAGGGMVSYGCGDGIVGIVNEGLVSGSMGQTLAPNLGYGNGIPGGQFNGLHNRGFSGLY